LNDQVKIKQMLAIRFLRSGRTNQSFFRVVLTEKGNPPKSKFIEALGWYNPKTKESSLKKEEILEWVGKGAKPSNSVAKLLIANKITHKNIVFVPDAPGKKKTKEEGDKPKQAAQAEEEKKDQEQVPEAEVKQETPEVKKEEEGKEPVEPKKEDSSEEKTNQTEE